MFDIIYDSIIFSPGFYRHLRISLPSILSKSIKKTKKISEAKQQQNITLNRILKRGSIKNLDGFLKTTENIIKKKRRLANVFKLNTNINK